MSQDYESQFYDSQCSKNMYLIFYVFFHNKKQLENLFQLKKIPYGII